MEKGKPEPAEISWPGLPESGNGFRSMLTGNKISENLFKAGALKRHAYYLHRQYVKTS